MKGLHDSPIGDFTRGGQTTLTNALVYSSKEARDAVLRTPMDKGMSISYDQLETLLASL